MTPSRWGELIPFGESKLIGSRSRVPPVRMWRANSLRGVETWFRFLCFALARRCGELIPFGEWKHLLIDRDQRVVWMWRANSLRGAETAYPTLRRVTCPIPMGRANSLRGVETASALLLDLGLTGDG